MEASTTQWLQCLLRVSFKGSGDSPETGKKNIQKARLKIINTNMPKGGPKLATTICNTYLVPAICWAPLLAQMPFKDLNSLDSLLTRQINTTIGLMRPTKSYGGGMRSFVGTDISGNTRELEATLANPADNGRALHSSLNLATELPTEHKPKTKTSHQGQHNQTNKIRTKPTRHEGHTNECISRAAPTIPLEEAQGGKVQPDGQSPLQRHGAHQRQPGNGRYQHDQLRHKRHLPQSPCKGIQK